MVDLWRGINIGLVLLATAFLPVSVFGQQPITQIEQIRDLSLAAAAQAIPVEVEGQVFSFNRSNHNLFLFNEDGAGIFVSWSDPEKAHAIPFSIGERVRISGVTDLGDFTPKIVADRLEAYGVSPLPDAPTLRVVDLNSGSNDCGWYTVTGRIESLKVFPDIGGGGSIALKVNILSQLVSVIVPLTDAGVEKANELMFKRIRFKAIAGAQSNADRQYVGRIFFLNSLDDCEVLEQWRESNELIVKPIHKIGRNTGNNFRRVVGTYGLVTHVDGDQVYLRGEEACLKVSTRGGEDIDVGDYIELNGVVVLGPLNPSFLAREITLIEHRDQPDPVDLELNSELLDAWVFGQDSRHNYELVQLSAELVEITEWQGNSPEDQGHILICRSGSQLFNVKAPFQLDAAEELTPGAMIQVSGICHLSRNWERTWRMSVEWFFIEPRSPADVVLLRAAPWWTAARLFWLVGAILGVSLLVVVWNISLRRTVDRQTAVIAEKIERESIDEERQRIARDLHDTLEQSLAALGMLLRITKTQITSVSVQATETLSKALGMHRSCVEQSRSAIVELREGYERVSIVSKLSQFVDELVMSKKGNIRLQVEGEGQTLQRLTSYYVYRICVEAVTNALNHAAPSEVVVYVRFTQESLFVRVTDDGCGFDVEHLASSDRFGLVGMRERAKKIHATLSIESELKVGTTLELEIPLTLND